MYAVGITLLGVIEQATGGWGLGGRMFSAVYFGDELVAASAGLLLRAAVLPLHRIAVRGGLGALEGHRDDRVVRRVRAARDRRHRVLQLHAHLELVRRRVRRRDAARHRELAARAGGAGGRYRIPRAARSDGAGLSESIRDGGHGGVTSSL